MIRSAGIIPYKISNDGRVLFFLGHPGGNDSQYHALLKGEVIDGEADVDAAVREFREESGVDFSHRKNDLVYLGEVKQNKKKWVVAYALEVDDIDTSECHSNMCENGVTPEIDRDMWMDIHSVEHVSHPAHIGFYKKIIGFVHGDN